LTQLKREKRVLLAGQSDMYFLIRKRFSLPLGEG
jgi:hypothetical protein